MNMSLNRDVILNYIKTKGPVLPSEIAKLLNTNILFASALLSELSSAKKIKSSHIKIGSSPLYYLPGQETMLEKYKDRLNPKDIETYELLKNKKVVEESQLTPLQRVSVASLKDFAKKIVAVTEQGEKVFWKWHSVNDEEAKKIINSIINPKKQPDLRKEPKKESKNKDITQAKLTEVTTSTPPQLNNELQKEINKPAEKSNDKFMGRINSLLEKKSINILWYNIIKKNSEIELIISVPSEIGEIKFYARARNKKRLNENDLAIVFSFAELKKLPGVLITPGSLTKRAEEMLNNEFQSIIFFKI